MSEEFPYLHSYRDRIGKQRYYIRRGSAEKVPVLGEFGSREFAANYQAALSEPPRYRNRKTASFAVPSGPLVYFVRSGNFVKIGYSSDGRARLRSLQQASASPLKVVLTISGGQELEREMHARFRQLRERGEWFLVDGPLLAFINQMSQTQNRAG